VKRGRTCSRAEWNFLQKKNARKIQNSTGQRIKCVLLSNFRTKGIKRGEKGQSEVCKEVYFMGGRTSDRTSRRIDVALQTMTLAKGA